MKIGHGCTFDWIITHDLCLLAETFVMSMMLRNNGDQKEKKKLVEAVVLVHFVLFELKKGVFCISVRRHVLVSPDVYKY